MTLNQTPQEIVQELDKYIIGQHEAKRNVAIALRNRWRRMQTDEDLRADIIPGNILMIGATGVGKTEIARRIARIANAPFIKVEASKYTEVGYMGRDVESMVRDLAEHSVSLAKAQRKAKVRPQAERLVEEMILDAIIPVAKSNNSADAEEDKEINKRTRDHFRQKIQNGEMEDRKMSIEVREQAESIGMFGPGMDESSMINLQEMLKGIMSQKTKRRRLPVKEARRLLLEEETMKLIDMDEVKAEGVQRAEASGIIFIDEIDKIASSAKSASGPDVSREGVQRDLLPIVEGTTVSTKYGPIKTDHILFIAAGAFHVSKPSDLIPELQGRFPIRVELDSLTQQDFARILSEPHNALAKQYAALFKAENVTLEIDPDAIQAIAEMAWQLNAEVENIGARRLQTVMSKLLNDYLFDMPDKISDGLVRITADIARAKISALMQDKDSREYIL